MEERSCLTTSGSPQCLGARVKVARLRKFAAEYTDVRGGTANLCPFRRIRSTGMWGRFTSRL